MTAPTAHILPREHITSVLKDAVRDYPLVVLTAPMGYGKTTAARELAGILNEQVFYVSVPLGPHNALYLWDLMVGQLAAQGLEMAVLLQIMGFPADAVRLQRTFEQGRTYFASHPTLLVVDDYHNVTDPAMDTLLEALVREIMPHFHILLLSRTRPNIALEDMRVKGIATLFNQNLLTFSCQETLAYFNLHGQVDTAIAESAWKFSEGWAAALWLSLQGWQTHGTITPLSDVETLLSETVFAAYTAADQAFLLQLSVLDHFTPRQAAATSNDVEAPRRLRTLHNRNAFISYDPASEHYQLHSLFRGFLEKRLEELPPTTQPAFKKSAKSTANRPLSVLEQIDKPALYRRAGEWFAATGDLVRSMRFFSRSGRDEDLLRILELFAVPSDGLFVMFDPEGVASMLQGIPWRVRYRCPIGWLAFIYHYMSRVNLEKGLLLLDEAAKHFAAEKSISPAMKQSIAGEIELIHGIEAFNDLFAMRDCYARAHTLLEGRSGISHPQLIWTFGSPHAAFLYLREPGTYKDLVELVEGNLYQYQELTGGCSVGAQDLFRAEVLLETGHPHTVEMLLMKAAYKAMTKEQLASIIAINFTMSRLLLSRGKILEARDVILNMDPRIWQTGNPLLRNSLDMCQGYLAAMAGYQEEIPLWLRQGNMAGVRNFYQGGGFALIVHGKALLAARDWLRLEALAEDIPARLGAYNNLFGHIHASVLHAIAVLHLHGPERATTLLHEAVEYARPDAIVCTISEYGEHITPLLGRMRQYNPEDPFLRTLHKAARVYAVNLSPDKSILAPQERAVLEKVMQELGNKAIADILGLSPNTVRNTLNRVYTKLGVKTRAQAIQKWRELQSG